jgi:1-deoxy-D-xylulose-5-phosphate synthase
MRFLKPLDRNAVINAASDHDLIVTIEENAIAGGAGSGVNELLNQESTGCGILNIGIPDRFIPHDSPAAMQASAGISSNEIEKAIVQRLETLTGKKR